MSAADASPTARLRLGRITTSVPNSEDFTWRILILLNVFRLILGSVLLVVFLAVTEPHIIGETNPTLAWGALLAMLATGFVEIWLLRNYHTSMPHAMHLHGFHFEVQERETSPDAVAALAIDSRGRLPSDLGRRDTVLVCGASSPAAIDPENHLSLLGSSNVTQTPGSNQSHVCRHAKCVFTRKRSVQLLE